MANTDVKVKEVRLLEAYSRTFNGFMSSTIAMTYRFRNIIKQKDEEARDLEHKIKDYLNLAQQKYTHARTAYEKSVESNRDDGGNELRQREQAVKKYKDLLQKSQNYAENAKKIYQKIHGEVERVNWMTERYRNKLEKSKEEGDSFLKKAITVLNEYKK